MQKKHLTDLTPINDENSQTRNREEFPQLDNIHKNPTVITILNGGRQRFLSKIRKNAKIYILTTLIQQVEREREEEGKDIDWKWRNKTVDAVSFYIENPKESTKNPQMINSQNWVQQDGGKQDQCTKSVAFLHTETRASLVAQPAIREIWVWSLGWEDSPGGEHGNPLWYSCLENPMDREAWWATDLGVSKSPTKLSD